VWYNKKAAGKSMNIISAAIALLLVMDPFGNIPVFLSILKNVEPHRKKKVILREMVIAFLVLVVFLFFGRYILSGLNISEPALNISGGVILFLIAVRMIFSSQGGVMEENGEEPMIVPLAVPLIAGPSTMALVILFSTQYPERMGEWFLALLLAWSITSVVLFLADFFGKILGHRGLRAVEKLMGMILTVLAVQMLLTGIREYLNLIHLIP
jgi:multiple antibiotic resistance protein